MSSIFDQPFIERPYREAEYIQGKSQVVGHTQASLIAPIPPGSVVTDPLTASQLRDPFLGRLIERLDLITAKAIQVEKEATVLPKSNG